MKNTRIPILILLAFLLFSSTYLLNAQNKNNFEIAKNLDIFSNIIKELNINYVDEIQPEKLIKVGIDAMLKELDPYTVFIPEEDIAAFDIITTGSYGGIGVLIHQQDGKIVASEMYEGFPAQIAGLRAGDQILKINDQIIEGKESSGVSDMIKGPANSSVKLTVKRYGEEQALDIVIKREIIKIKNVPYFSLINKNIGYINLVGFSQNASKEVKNAIAELKTQTDLKGLILDLRNNGGGLMSEAIDIVNLFVDKNQEVVSTKGKIEELNSVHKTRFNPIDKDIPLAVLVNSSSASSSEIVAGALQDLDRAIIIGQRSFGKGLVQNVLPLSYNTRTKITIAKYYIPSGRCIQAIDYSLKDENGHFTTIPDSLITAYKTKSGRTVFDGGGIEPDIKLEPNVFSQITSNLYGRLLFFDYATKFRSENKSIDSPEKFQISEEIYDDFLAYLKQENYTYKTQHERALDLLKKQAEKNDSFEAIKSEFKALEAAITKDKETDFIKHQEEIKRILKMEIVSRYYFTAGKIASSLDKDSELDKATEVLNDQSQYQALLLPKPEKLLVKK